MLAPEPDRPVGPTDRPIRVAIDAHTVGRQQTGNERYVVELASALAARPDLDVLAYVDRGTAWPAGRSPAPRIVELRARAPQLRIPFELPLRAWRDRAALLHVTYVGPPVAGRPLVTTVHDVSFVDRPELFALPTRLRLRWLVRLSVRRSAAVIAISHFTRQRLIDVYGLPEERVHQVPVGIGDEWRPMDAVEAAPLLEGLGVPARFVLAVGTSHPRKNLPRLVQAVRELRAGGHGDLELVLAGPPGPSGDLGLAIAAAGAQQWVHRIGYVGDDALRALYSKSAAVAFVSLYEGFGLPVVEALACGAIVVASSTTAVGEAAGDAGVLVDPADVGSIAAGLRSALEDESMRIERRRRAAQHVSRFSWPACAAQTAAVYRAVLGRS